MFKSFKWTRWLPVCAVLRDAAADAKHVAPRFDRSRVALEAIGVAGSISSIGVRLGQISLFVNHLLN